MHTAATIQDKLLDRCWELGVSPLFAVESGSRAWGFESRDSDFDVRFIYRSALSRYARVTACPDTIESAQFAAGDPLLDYVGWDFKKFLQLALKSNPSVFEWLQCDTVYHQVDEWAEVRRALKPFFSPRAALGHYISMAKHNYREHMRDGQSPTVRLKKYLYITRPLLCARWIETHLARKLPPIRFCELLENDGVGGLEVGVALKELADRKRAGDELDSGEANPCINRWIDAELARLPRVAENAPVGTGDPDSLDRLFGYLVLS